MGLCPSHITRNVTTASGSNRKIQGAGEGRLLPPSEHVWHHHHHQPERLTGPVFAFLLTALQKPAIRRTGVTDRVCVSGVWDGWSHLSVLIRSFFPTSKVSGSSFDRWCHARGRTMGQCEVAIGPSTKSLRTQPALLFL